MRLVTVRHNGVPRVAVLTGDGVVALVDLGGRLAGMQQVIEGGDAALAEIRAALKTAPTVPLSSVELMAPIPMPRRNLMCVGKNYYEHAHEFHDSGFDSSGGRAAVPTVPIIFTKATTCIVGPGAEVRASSDPTSSVDYEGELAVVIGKVGRAVTKERALDHVFGYTIVNDVTSRELQKRHNQWFIGKSIDTFCPMGPCIVTADEIDDLARLTLITEVNGEVRQNASVADLIFDVPTLIATVSASTTLLPGDIIATGTPSGVGIGFTPPRYLAAGDRVRVRIDGIGALENPIC